MLPRCSIKRLYCRTRCIESDTQAVLDIAHCRSRGIHTLSLTTFVESCVPLVHFQSLQVLHLEGYTMDNIGCWSTLVKLTVT